MRTVKFLENVKELESEIKLKNIKEISILDYKETGVLSSDNPSYDISQISVREVIEYACKQIGVKVNIIYARSKEIY